MERPPLKARRLSNHRFLWALGLAAVAVLIVTAVGLALRSPRGHWNAVEEARAHLGNNRPDLALKAVSHIRDDAPGAAEAMAIAGEALIHYQRFPAARGALERAIALDRNQAKAARMLAAVYLASGDGPRGVAMLQHVANLEPEDYRPWLTMGRAHLDLGEFGQAADAFEEAVQRDPPEPDRRTATIGRIRALLLAHQPEVLDDPIAEALERYPNNGELLALAARQARDLGRTEEALDFAERALAIQPSNADALLVRAMIRNERGNLEGALADLDRAAFNKPHDPGLLQLKAQIEARLGLDEQSARTLERRKEVAERLELMDELTEEITHNPDDPEPRWRLGRAALEAGMLTLASQAFQAALGIDPEFEPAREDLERVRRIEAVRDRSSGSGVESSALGLRSRH